MLSNDIRTIIPAPQMASHGGGVNAYSRNPMLVYWETTQACALACKHCRAEASPQPQAGELSHSEGMTLLRQIAGFTPPLPHLVLTGGDPLMRADIFEIIDEARRLGLSVSITPSVTPALTAATLEKLMLHGVSSAGLSLDGSTADRHEAVRGVRGCFDWTMRAIEDAAKLGLPLQINTLVSQETLSDLPHVYELLKSRTIMRWSLFFLVSVGRGKILNPITPDEAERCMEWVFDLSQAAPFDLKTTEAPAYRRVALDKMRKAEWPVKKIRETAVYRGFGIRDGHGIVFVSNQGNIYPAGFLPLITGNVRHDHLVDVYRNSAVFRALHAPETFKGKCGRCEYRALCGGSRARGFAATGDPLASDPLCVYEPPEPHSVASAPDCMQCEQCKRVACAMS
jgi:AdoMet-dependent heme synthase